MNLKGRTQLFTQEDVIKGSRTEDYRNQIVVISEKRLNRFKSEFQSPHFQLFYATGGFGCNPESMGTAVFGTFLADGEEIRMERYDFLGILKPELAKEYELEVETNA